jgi:hypothetical protein
MHICENGRNRVVGKGGGFYYGGEATPITIFCLKNYRGLDRRMVKKVVRDC